MNLPFPTNLPLVLGFSFLLWSPSPAAGSGAVAEPVPEQIKKQSKKVKTQIHWLVKPAKVEIYLDGKRLGAAKDLKLTATKPGKHTIRLVNGLDETEFDMEIRKNQTLRFEFIFES
jgi:hypothetical protein